MLRKTVVITNVMKTFAMLCTNIVLKAPTTTIIRQLIVKMLLIVLRIAVENAEI